MVLSLGAFAIILLLPLTGRLVKGRRALHDLFRLCGRSGGVVSYDQYEPGDGFSTAVKLRIYQMVFVAFLFVLIQTMSYAGIPRVATT